MNLTYTSDVTERVFPTCIACGGRLNPAWFRLRHAKKPKRWAFSLHFGGRGRIRRGDDFLVAQFTPDQVVGWLGSEYATQMAAAVFSAAVALQAAGWPMPWVMADARELERLRYLDRMVAAHRTPTAIYASPAPAWQATPIEDRTARLVDVSPRLKGAAVLEVTGGLGPATLEEK
ncbi:MAG TPA: hypothetical protein VGL81_30860 [Polyangiaceae bacterium]|jgi:hypothetical protein